jgi:hypothetical protein
MVEQSLSQSRQVTEREIEEGERCLPAPWLEELEPVAMAMGDSVSVE